MKQIIVYTVKSNRQLGQDADNGAIGGGRGWACAGRRAIGGDALAMQVHACPRAHLPTLISGSAHPRQLRAWSSAAPSGVTLACRLERALVAALVSRAGSDSAGNCRSAGDAVRDSEIQGTGQSAIQKTALS
jgi:hypothetical protein